MEILWGTSKKVVLPFCGVAPLAISEFQRRKTDETKKRKERHGEGRESVAHNRANRQRDGMGKEGSRWGNP
jgi:hypothetical protein